MFDRISSVVGIALQIYNKEYTSHFLQELNPWNDPVIDMLQLMRLTAQREWNARNGRFKRGYWDRLPIADQLLAEAESDYLSDFIHSTIYYELLRKSEFLDAEQERFEKAGDEAFITFYHEVREGVNEMAKAYDSTFGKGDPKHNYTTRDHAKRLVQSEATYLLFPPDHPSHSIEAKIERAVVDDTGPERTYLIRLPLERETDWLRDWRTWVGPKQELLRISHVMLMNDFTKKLEFNELDGASAKKHLLLTNSQVPMPTLDNILGWWQYCGVSCRRLTQGESYGISRWAGFMPGWIMTYIPPMMPMSKEHLAGGGIMDSHSAGDFSLTAKSKGHKRDPENRIQYGHWQVRTVVFNREQIETVASEQFDSLLTNKMGFADRHAETLPNVRAPSSLLTRGEHNLFLLGEGLDDEKAGMLWSSVADPHMHQEHEERYFPRFHRSSAGDSWFSLSKFMGVHVRFDYDNFGTIALTDWYNEFNSIMQQYSYMTHAQRKAIEFQKIIQLQAEIRKPANVAAIKRGSNTVTFDFSLLS